MAIFKVEGGRRLRGEITPQGAKNEALQILCATLLTQEKVIVHNVPQILDVIQLIELLQAMGVEVERLSEESYSFRAADIDPDYLRSDDYCRRASRLRGSVMLLGPMLARFGVGYMPKPGGDKIGRRRLDTHFIGFQKLGATLDFDTAAACSEVRCKELKGCYMLLDEASVTGTANIIMAAVMAKGFTTIYNAACEPYIQQLCLMLNRMGARISGIASNLLTIEGVRELHGTEHTLLPDMIEVGSFIGLAAMTRSELTIRNVSFENLGIIPAQFARLGIRFEQHGDDIYIPQQEHYRIENFMDGSIMTIADAPWPGLTPDLLSVFLVVATQAKGSVLIHQKMFESRLFFVDKLIDMIEVGSFIGLAAMTRSELTIRNVSFENLGIIPAQFARLGIRFEQHGDDIYIPQQEHYRIENFMDGSIMTIADAPWPGLTPDLLSVFLVVATQAKGSVLIHQKMFESRLFFVDKLIDMGAQIILCDPHRATVIGHDHQMRLRATRMTSPDIRAGVALLIAAMSAEGTSTIQNIEQIDRGYKDIDGRLNALGARITRVEE